MDEEARGDDDKAEGETKDESKEVVDTASEVSPSQSDLVERDEKPKGHGWLTISNWAVGLIGLLIGVVSFLHPIQQTREVSYSVPYTNTKVFDSSVATTYKIVDQNNVAITNDIYTTEFSLWNSGSVPIEPPEVRSPVRIILFPAQRILDYSIVTQTRPDIARFTVREIDVAADSILFTRYSTLTAADSQGAPINDVDRRSYMKALELRWDHLDPGFGVKVRVTYLGQGARDKDFRVRPDVYIIGINDLQFGRKPLIQRWLPISDGAMILLFTLVVVLPLFIFTIMTSLTGRRSTASPDIKAVIRTLVIVWIVVIVTLGYQVFTRTPGPPFDILPDGPPVQSVE